MLLLSAFLSTLVLVGPLLLFIYSRRRRNDVADEIEDAMAVKLTARLEKRFPAHDVRYVLDSLPHRDLANPDVLDALLSRVESLQLPVGREAKSATHTRFALIEDQLDVLTEQIKRLDRKKFDAVDLLSYTAAALAFLVGIASAIAVIQHAF